MLEIIKNQQLTKKTENELTENFNVFLKDIEASEKKAQSIEVTDISQVKEMQEAREFRLELKDIRVKADKKRVELKAESLKYGKAVQTIYNFIESKIKPLEKHLELQEKFIEIKQEKEEMELREKRNKIVDDYLDFYNGTYDFGIMAQTDFDNLIKDLKEKKKVFLEMEQFKKEKAEREKKQAEEENKRIQAENEKLKEENKKIALEKEKAEKAKAEAEATLKAKTEEKEETMKSNTASFGYRNSKKQKTIEIVRQVKAITDAMYQSNLEERTKNAVGHHLQEAINILKLTI